MTKKALLGLIIAGLALSASAQTATSPAAAGTAETAQKSSFFDSVTDSVKGWWNKGTDETSKYSQELKEKWPSIKEQFQENWNKGVQQGEKASDAVGDWFSKTFSDEKIEKAQAWLKDFKTGTEEKVIDPLVPYLLSLRYPNPAEEWQAGYRRVFPVQMTEFPEPVEVQLPLSWDMTQDMLLPSRSLMTWRSEGGMGSYALSLVQTPAGANSYSIVAALTQARPDATVETVGSSIKRVAFPAANDTENAYYYYAVPLGDKTVEVCGAVLRGKDQTTADLNKLFAERGDFFNLVVSNIFLKTRQ